MSMCKYDTPRHLHDLNSRKVFLLIWNETPNNTSISKVSMKHQCTYIVSVQYWYIKSLEETLYW